MSFNDMTLKELKQLQLYKDIPRSENKSKLNKADLINLLNIYQEPPEEKIHETTKTIDTKSTISTTKNRGSDDNEQVQTPVNTSRVCLRVKNLRSIGYDDLKNWLEDSNNVYVGRRGRIFVNKEIFHYKGHPFQNPFKVSSKDYTLDESLRKYNEYIEDKIKTDPEYLQILRKLKGKNLGCYCEKQNRCHADIIIKLIENFQMNNKIFKLSALTI